MSFLLRILLVAVASLCLVGTRLVMQRHLSTETARLAPINTLVGATNFPSETADYKASSDARRYVSIANVGVGTATLLFGTWSLLHRGGTASSQLPRTSWNVGPSPAGGGQPANGTSLFVTRRF